MIQSFVDQATEDIFNGSNTRQARKTCPRILWSVVFRKLDQLDSAERLDELRIPPGNCLEALSGGRRGQYSIRINDQYRICFRWSDLGPRDVEIVDYPGCDTKAREAMIRIPTSRLPTHPGEMLLEEFLKPMGLTQREVADGIHVPYQRVNELVNRRRGVTPSTALRLAKYFGTSPGFWMNLQLRWDLFLARQAEESVLRRIHRVQATL